MNHRSFVHMAVLVVFLPMLASRSAAQMKVEVGATIGYYAPLGSFRPAAAYSTSLPNQPSDMSGGEYGALLRLWATPRIGFELMVATSSSTVGGGITPGGEAPTSSVRITSGAAQLLFRLTGDDSRVRAWVGAGGGAIRHGGRAYEPFGSPANAAAVVSLGSAVRIRGGLNAEVGVMSMIYNLDVHGDASGVQLSEGGGQLDLTLRTGVSYSWH